MKTAKDRKIVVHKLKTWAEYFKVIINGSKTFELRKNDRDFKVGDRLDLMEYDPKTQSFTGNHCQRFVSYIIGDNPFVNLNGYVILGLALDKEIEQDNGVKSLREIAMNMWNNLTLSDKIDLMGNFEEYVGRKPSTLTGREIEILFFGKREIEQGEKCPDCEGTGKDGHDRCDPPNWYICEKCNGTGKVAIKPTKAEADSDKRKSVKEFCKAYINPRLDKNYDVHLTGEELFNLLLEFSQQREVTDDDIKTEMDNYFNKLQRNPLPDIERFRIEMAFEYAAKWTREQMKNR